MSRTTTLAHTGARPRRMAGPSPDADQIPQAVAAEVPAAGSPDKPSTPAAPKAPSASTPKPPRRPSKQDAVLALLTREEGATLAEMMAATGWLAHSTRAVLTGLRKKGHAITKSKRDKVTRYCLGKDA